MTSSSGGLWATKRSKLNKKIVTYTLFATAIVIIVLLNLLQVLSANKNSTAASGLYNANFLNKNLRKFSQECQTKNYKFGASSLFFNSPSDQDQEKNIGAKKYQVSRETFNQDDVSSNYETISFDYFGNPDDSNESTDNQEDYSATPTKFNYQSPVLILSSIMDAGSYGDAEVRQFKHFFKVLHTINYNRAKISLGLSIKSVEELEKVKFLITEYYEATNVAQYFSDVLQEDEELDQKNNSKFNKITLVHAPFIENSFQITRENRHAENIQKKRRSVIAKVRNFLLNTVLHREKYTLFIDSDIIEIPENLLNYFIKSNKDIVVPRIQKGEVCFDYDQNSWFGDRTTPSAEEFAKLNHNKQLKQQEKEQDFTEAEKQQSEFIYVPNRTGNTRLLIQLSRHLQFNSEEAFNYLHPLDSVGGAILFVKSVIFKQGIQFPPLYIVGTDWARLEGYDGIETEGLCYQARILGYECWGMPDVVAQHYNS